MGDKYVGLRRRERWKMMPGDGYGIETGDRDGI